MIRLLDLITFFLLWGNALVIFMMIREFLVLRKNLFVQIAAFLLSPYLFNVVVFSNDLVGVLWPLLGFFLYTIVFYRGKWMEKLTTVLVFYPAVIAVNYIIEDSGSRLFFWITNASDHAQEWTRHILFVSTMIHTCFVLARGLFWLSAYLLLRKYRSGGCDAGRYGK